MATSAHSQERVPAANRKTFDGSVVVPHIIQVGETLSNIAANYHMPSWEPIWIYNTKIEKILGDDPGSIRRGVTILVPRSRKGYETLIARLKALSEQMKTDGDKIVYELEAQRYDLKAAKELLNLAGDVATLGATLYLKLGNVCKLARVAEASKGQAKIGARLIANGAGQSFAADFKAARTRLIRSALRDHQAMQGAKKGVTDFYKDKAIDAGTKFFDNRVQQAQEDNDTTPGKHLKNAWAGGRVLRHTASHGLSAAALGDVAEIVLDYIEPAGVAEKYLKWRTGESAEGTIEQMIKTVRQVADENAKLIALKAEKYQKEAAVVYG